MTSDIYIFRHFPATLFCNMWLHKQEAAKHNRMSHADDGSASMALPV